MDRLFSLSRYILIVPAIVTLVGAIVLIIAGTITLFNETVVLFSGGLTDKALKQASADYISVIDVFLLATVMYIIAVGLYELFIGRLDLPEWLTFKNFDDLKAQLISVVIAVLAVLALSAVVSASGTPLLQFGLAVSPIILALTLFLTYKTTKAAKEQKNDKGDA